MERLVMAKNVSVGTVFYHDRIKYEVTAIQDIGGFLYLTTDPNNPYDRLGRWCLDPFEPILIDRNNK